MLLILLILFVSKNISAYHFTANEILDRKVHILNSTFCKVLSNVEILCEYATHSYVQKPLFNLESSFEKKTKTFYMKALLNINSGPGNIIGERNGSIPYSFFVKKINIYVSLNMQKNINAILMAKNSKNIFERILPKMLDHDGLNYATLDLNIKNNSTHGILLINNDCFKNKTDLNYWTSCINLVAIAAFLTEPTRLDFYNIKNHSFGIFPDENNILDVWIEVLNIEVQSIGYSSSLQEHFSLIWLLLLNKTAHLIKEIDASNNFVFALYQERTMFLPMNNLIKLNLSYCHLDYITDTFETIKNLEILDLSHNFLFQIPQAIQNLKQLKTFNMSYQNVDAFFINSTTNLPDNIKEFRLNDIPIINHSEIILPKDVQILDLSRCKLSNMLIKNMDQLEDIYLSGNYIENLEENIFSNSTSLNKIDLSHNYLRSNLNIKLKNVTILDLSYNSITSPIHLISTGKINYLDLTGNKIINWTSPATANNNLIIENLNLSRNDIVVINKYMIPFLDNLNSIDIGFNLFDCQDCSLIKFQHWLNITNITIFNNGDKDKSLLCEFPINQRGEILQLAIYNETACILKVYNYPLIIGLPISLILIIIMSGIVILNKIYKYEIQYIKHLLKVRKKQRKIDNNSEYLYDVFVSYSNKDRDWVMQILLPNLENDIDKYELCLHERNFKIGSYIMDNIIECIENSKHVLLILSTNFIQSEWCTWELRMVQQKIFENNKQFLILLELEKINQHDKLPVNLKDLMNTRTYLEWPNKLYSAEHSEVIKAFKKLKYSLGPAINKKHIETDDKEEAPLNIDEMLQKLEML